MGSYDFGTIEISIEDPKSIDDAVMKILLLKRGLMKAMSELYKFMLDEGVEIARHEIVRLCNRDMMSGNLWMSVKSSPELVYDEATGIGRGYITAGEGLKTGKDGMSYAVYVEFGTGVSSKERKKQEAESKFTTSWGSPLKLPGNKKASESTLDPVKPMHFQGADGQWYTTYGQPPKPFMTNTMFQLWQKAQKKWAELISQYVPHETGG